MLLPYSREVYFAAMAACNAAWWPVVLLAGLLAVLATALAFRPSGRMTNGVSHCIAGYLAAAWLWTGAAHQLAMMAELNFMAPVYGAGWLGQGVLLAGAGLYPGKLSFGFRPGLSGALAKTLLLFALVIYPLVSITLAPDWRSLPVAGTAPNPTAVLTVALLLATRTRPPLFLFAIPLAWAAVTAVSAYLLGQAIDYAVAIAILAAAALAVHEWFKNPAGSAP